MFSLQFDIPNGLYSLSSFSDLQIILKFNVCYRVFEPELFLKKERV